MKVLVNANYTELNDKIYILFLSMQKSTRHCMTFPFSHPFFWARRLKFKADAKGNGFFFTIRWQY